MTDEGPDFIIASNEERAAWRDIKMTKAAREYLLWEGDRLVEAALLATRKGMHAEALVLTGKLEGLRELEMNLFQYEDVAHIDDNPNFVDPAAPWPKRRKA